MSTPTESAERTPLQDDRELFVRAQQGHRHAFEELYLRHVRPVYWQVYAVVRNESDAEDATQDAFITTWKKLDSISLVDNSLLPWLLVTARYTALNKRRQSNRHNSRQSVLDDAMEDRAFSIEERVEIEDVLVRVEKYVAELSTVDRALYDLCIDGDRTYAEAAKELGVTHGAIRNRLARIRQRLRTDVNVLRGSS